MRTHASRFTHVRLVVPIRDENEEEHRDNGLARIRTFYVSVERRT